MYRQVGLRRQGVMRGQEMGRRNVSSGHVCAVRNVSSQCVVSVTAKSDTQDAVPCNTTAHHHYVKSIVYTEVAFGGTLAKPANSNLTAAHSSKVLGALRLSKGKLVRN